MGTTARTNVIAASSRMPYFVQQTVHFVCGPSKSLKKVLPGVAAMMALKGTFSTSPGLVEREVCCQEPPAW